MCYKHLAPNGAEAPTIRQLDLCVKDQTVTEGKVVLDTEGLRLQTIHEGHEEQKAKRGRG